MNNVILIAKYQLGDTLIGWYLGNVIIIYIYYFLFVLFVFRFQVANF